MSQVSHGVGLPAADIAGTHVVIHGVGAIRAAYYTVKRQWQSILPEQEAFFSKFRDRRHRIGARLVPVRCGCRARFLLLTRHVCGPACTEKDVVRTDRSEPIFRDEMGVDMNKLREILLTYTFYNFDLGQPPVPFRF